MKIAVAGTGYVGLSISVLLAQHNEVWAVDILPEKVALLAARKSPIADKEIERYLAEKELDLHPTTDAAAAYTGADIIVVSTPTNYDPKKNYFDTSSVEAVLTLAGQYAPEATIVIKSTVPVGYTASVRKKFHNLHILFSPEFLREGHALYDNLYPSRIVVGCPAGDGELAAPCPYLCGAFTAGGHQAECGYPLPGPDRGRGHQAVCQHLPGPACGLF